MDISYYKQFEPFFGSWHITRLIGEGSFGKVFEIERTEFGRTYKAALKAITIPERPSEIKDALMSGMSEQDVTAYYRSIAENVIAEFDMMAKMKGHSNIVSCEDYAVTEHKLDIGWDVFIRMELLTPADDYFAENGCDESSIINLGIDLCKALEVCQKNKIIHRDIKPQNIFISENGDFKLGDFGVAKTIEKTTGELSKKGTYSYMAPEVYKCESYDSSVDIYSVGIVLYRYLNNNRTPFLPQPPVMITHSAQENALEKRMSGEKLPLPANASTAFSKIILKACKYDPTDRYCSPAEMRRDLETCMGGGIPQPPKPKIIDPPPPEPNGSIKPIIKVIIAVLLIIALIGGIIALVIKTGEKENPKDDISTTADYELSDSDDPIENQIVEILMNDAYFNTEYLYRAAGTEFYYTFLDLDFDGINELIINEYSEADGYGYNNTLKFELETQSYKFLYINGYGDFDVNNGDIRLFSGKGDKPYYVAENIDRYSIENSYSSVWMSLIKLFYAPGEDAPSDIYSSELFSVDLSAYSNESAYTYYDFESDKEYKVKSSEIDGFLEEKKEEFLDTLSKEDRNLNLKYQVISGQEYNAMSAKDKEKALRTAYRAFDYDGRQTQ